MTKFHTTTLLATDLAKAYDAMVDEAVTTEKYDSLGNTEVAVETTEHAAGHRIHARRKVALDLPGFMTKIMSPTNSTTRSTSGHRLTAATTAPSRSRSRAHRCTSRAP